MLLEYLVSELRYDTNETGILTYEKISDANNGLSKNTIKSAATRLAKNGAIMRKGI